MQESQMGTLYVVATPIGNMDDMTLRAIEVLRKVDRIVAEDTRHSAPLLRHLQIEKPAISMHEFNERDRLAVILDYIQAGQSVALISDAGTPLISDPGFHLVKKAREMGMSVVAIPGACAAIAALSVAGLPTDRFTFEGFLPAKSEGRRKRLGSLLHESRTLVFYEAPHRLLASLSDMREVFGVTRLGVVARELTKLYEEVRTGDFNNLIDYYEKHPDKVRGEIVILVHGIQEEKSESKEVIPEEVLTILLEAMPLKQAAMLASRITGARKNELYELALAKKEARS